MEMSRRSSVILSSGLAVALVGCAFGAPQAMAQGKLDSTYTASLAGITLGRGAWVITIGENQFTSVASGVTAGMMNVFGSGQGSGIARGAIAGGVLVPATYGATITAGKKAEELRMTLSGGTVKELSITPPPKPDPERIPVTDAHRRAVLDPMTASFVRVPGTGDLVAPDACRRSTAIFDGRLRYDLKLDYKRIEKVKADKGYAGPAVVCSISFMPIAGYIPDRPAIKYLTEQRDMEAWLVPLAGTRFLVPFRVIIPTPLGTAALQANEFVTTPQVTRLSPADVKSQ